MIQVDQFACFIHKNIYIVQNFIFPSCGPSKLRLRAIGKIVVPPPLRRDFCIEKQGNLFAKVRSILLYEYGFPPHVKI